MEKLDRFINEISSEFINLEYHEISEAIILGLQKISNLLDIERIVIYVISNEFNESVFEWKNHKSKNRNLTTKEKIKIQFPWLICQLEKNQQVIISNLSQLPESAQAEIELFSLEKVHSMAAVPVFHKSNLAAWIELSSTSKSFELDQDIISRIKNCVNIFMSALTRKKNEEKIILLNAELEKKIHEKSIELTTLLNIQKALTTELHVDHVIQLIADEARRLTNTKIGTLFLLEDDILKLKTFSGDHRFSLPKGYEISLKQSIPGVALKTGSPLLIEDVNDTPEIFQDFVNTIKVKSILLVPLLSGRTAIGVISVADKETGVLGKDDERLLKMFANVATIALGNAHIYQQEQDRREEAERGQKIAEALRDILRILNSKLELPEVLFYIANQSKDLLNATSTMVRKINYEKSTVITEASANLPEAFDVIKEIPFYEGGADRILRENKPVAVSDLSESLGRYLDDPQELSEPQKDWVDAILRYFKSHLIVPLIISENLYGTLTFYYEEQREFSTEDIHLALTLATQVSLAIENARLRDTEKEIAVAAERNRLARDLHDAVTQTLFSATLIAEVLPKLWKKNPSEAEQRLEELRQLTRGALAEMRTLLLELRPSALMDASLPELMKQLCEALNGRSRLPVDLQILGDEELPGEVKVAVYRIAQEALNNIAKHADPEEVFIQIQLQKDHLRMMIHDDGKGMVIKEAPSNHLGLNIMRERAQSINAKLSIESEPKEGTTIIVDWENNFN
jgi:signal transduction histidine kinase/putative methionine-R-sulfoxide reductase with GAF domain